MPPTTKADARAVLAAKQQASYLASKVKAAFTAGELSTVQDIESRYGIKLDLLSPNGVWSDQGRKMPLSQITVDYICQRFIDTTAERLQKAEDDLAAAPQVNRLYVQPDPTKRWRFTLNPNRVSYQEQDPVIREISKALFVDNKTAILCPGGTGAGKTVIASAVIDEAIHRFNYHKYIFPLRSPILWVTVPNAEVQTRRDIIASGMGAYLDNNIIQVIGYNHIGTALGELNFCAKTVTEDSFDPTKPPVTTYTWHPHAVSRLIILDEFHKLKNVDSNTTKQFRALVKLCQTYPIPQLNARFLCLTATPFEKVSDSRFFVTTAGINYGGITINDENFNTQFANLIAKGDPDEINAAAIRRLYNAVSSHVIEIPYVPWSFKAINSIRMYDFLTPEDKQFVADAYNRHLERLEKMGKEAPLGLGALQGSFTIMRKETEPVRMAQIVEEMVDLVSRGEKVAACATAYTGSIIKALDILTNKYKVSRQEISIVWGGRENVKPEPVLDDMQLFEFIQEVSQQPDGITGKQRRFIEKQMAWREDRILFGDATENDQNIRYARLRALNLIGTQTKTKRQEEIDRFQSGQSKYLFYTAASGGTGLSLPDYDRNITKPRELWATPIYSSQEFTQVLGRCPRRNSISNTIQRVCGMLGTIESEHVMPLLDRKLQAAGEFVSRKNDLTRTLSELFLRDIAQFTKSTFTTGNIRTAEQAAVDAVTNEDTQIHAPDVVDDEDEDENN